MRHQIIKIIQKQEDNHKNFNTFKIQKIKSQLLNRTDRQSILHHHHNINNEQPNDRSTLFSPEIQLRKTKNLLNKVRSVRRIHLEDNQSSNLDDSKTLLKDSYNERSIFEQKLDKKMEFKNEKQDWMKFVKSARVRQKEQYDQKKQEIRQLIDQIRGFNSEIKKLDLQNQSLRKQVQRLILDNEKITFENQKMKIDLTEYNQHVQHLKKQQQITQKISTDKCFELQQFINSLKEENQVLNSQVQRLKSDRISLQERLERISIQSQNLTITIFPLQNREVEKLQKLKLQILTIQRNLKANINLIKKQHQKEIFNLRNSYFKNLNFYRNLIKKWSSSFIADALRQPEQLLKTDLIQLDEDLQSFSLDINAILQKQETTSADLD